MARGTQHRKRRPAANARVAQPAAASRSGRSRPSWEDQLFFSRLRAHAKWVFVFLGARLRGRLRDLRRRLRLDRDQRRPPELLQRHLEHRLVALVAPEEDGRASEEREGLARPRDQARAGQQGRRGDRGADHVHDAQAEETRTRCASSAGIYLRRAQAYNTLYLEAQARAQALAPSSILPAEVRLEARPGAHVAAEPGSTSAVAGADEHRDEQRSTPSSSAT